MKYDVFISYSRKDYVDEHGNVIPNNEVSKIMTALSEAGISYWFDKEGVIHGEDFGEKILKYIKMAKIFVYLSTAAANDSEWTRKEIASAVMYKKKVIPVRIDESPYHDSVMFRIADLDYINYASNPKKGREELVESILRYKAEEQAAAARREAEEQRRREEQEKQHKQQEELRRRQQETDKLREEISKTEEECSELEKTILLKQHDLGVVNLELESKRKHLEEQKLQMNAILFDNNGTNHDDIDNIVTSGHPAEDTIFEFHWLHPRDSIYNMWKKIKETMALRHWIVNVILCLILCITFFCFLISIIGLMVADEDEISLPLCACSFLSFYALWQLLLNKRSGAGLLLISPILFLPILFLSGFDGYTYYSSYDYCRSHSKCIYGIEGCLVLLMFFYAATIFVLLFFYIRKKGTSAWNLLQGKFIHALQLHRYVGYYVMYSIIMSLACFHLDHKACEFEDKSESAIRELLKGRNSIELERDSVKVELNSIKHERDSIAKRYELLKEKEAQKGFSVDRSQPSPSPSSY